MKIQIVDSATGEVLLTPRGNATLETDLLATFGHAFPWWRPFSRRHAAFLRSELTRVAAELRQATL